MLQFLSAYQHKLVVTDLLYTVPDYPPDPFSILDEVQFKLLVTVQRIGEFRLVTLHDIETILVRKSCNFCKNLCHATNIHYFLKYDIILTCFIHKKTKAP